MMGGPSKTIVWFRRDLRIEDNPALSSSTRDGPSLPVFIWCPNEEGQFYPGRCSRWWLKQSLAHLNQSLKSMGVPLVFIKAESTVSALLQCVNAVGATRVVYNRLYDPVSLVRDHAVKNQLFDHGIAVQSFNGDLLYEPWEVYDENGHSFTTFNEFWNKCLSLPSEPVIFPPPWQLVPPSGIENIESCSIEDLNLENESEKQSNALLSRVWSPGWSNADKILFEFSQEKLLNYSKNRMKLEGATTSLLSPYLHFGEISVRKIYHSARIRQIQLTECETDATESVTLFLRSIGLREYSRHLCFNFPFAHEQSLLGNLKHYPWRGDREQFKLWRQGRTGYPLVDAGMRELWATGWMHNRTRVIVSSFFVKFLLLPWTWGMKYFWDTLLDADLENDILGWQYVAGALPDGHELTRLDSPEEQGKKIDPNGEYIRNWIPELARMPTQWIHHPWDAPNSILMAAGVDLGSNYPKPIIGIDAARERLDDAVSMMWELDRAAKTERTDGSGEVVADNVPKVSVLKETSGMMSERTDGSSEIVADNVPKVAVLKETSGMMSSIDQRVPSVHDASACHVGKGSTNFKFVVKKAAEFGNGKGTAGEDEDMRSTAESSSAKKRNIGEAEFDVPMPCFSASDGEYLFEFDGFKQQFLRGSSSTQPMQKENVMSGQDEETDAESSKVGLRPCKKPA